MKITFFGLIRQKKHLYTQIHKGKWLIQIIGLELKQRELLNTTNSLIYIRANLIGIHIKEGT
jgi:hypothetical protein